MDTRVVEPTHTQREVTLRDGAQYTVVTPSLVLKGCWDAKMSTSMHLYFRVGAGHFIVLERDVMDLSPTATLHPKVVLTGGSIPAHAPGAYANLSCCGGSILVRPVGWEGRALSDPLLSLGE